MDIKEKEILLNPLLDEDIPLFSKWLDKAYIYRWFCPEGEEYRQAWMDEVTNRNEKFSFMHHFIITYDNKKIGFGLCMDCYFEQQYISEHYGIIIDKKESVYEIGYLIGEEEYLNKGLGKIIVRKLEEKIIEMGGKEILADPDEDNVISIKTLLSNGFIKVKDGDYRKRLLNMNREL